MSDSTTDTVTQEWINTTSKTNSMIQPLQPEECKVKTLPAIALLFPKWLSVTDIVKVVNEGRSYIKGRRGATVLAYLDGRIIKYRYLSKKEKTRL